MSRISKILKVELFTLFILTVISFISFYYQDILPDNYLSITSEKDALPFVTYHLTSLISFVGYYTGPWVFVPFIIFAIFYTFQFSRRELFLDTINFLSLTFGTLLLTGHFFSDFMGAGAAYLIKHYLSPSTSLISGLLLMFAFFAGSFRNSFKEALINFFVFLGRIPGMIWSKVNYLNPLFWYRECKVLKEKLFGFFHIRISTLLKGREKKKKPLTSKATNQYTLANYEEKEFEEEKITPLTKRVLEVPSDVKEVQNTILEKESKNTKRLKKKSMVSDNYYSLLGTLAPKSKSIKSLSPDGRYFEDIINRIESKLLEFRIEGRIINILKGPVVDTFELELGSGVKVSRVMNHEADLALALYGAPIRIVYPMIGKPTMGIEVPRDPREFIYLDEVLNSSNFESTRHKLPIGMGKNAFGEIFVVDLAAMPHMLVAGATGAGKSVFINSLLVSLLIKKSPSQMKLILIDPKQLELAIYHNLPHLMMPVITDAKTASIALLWACQEMERRYSILKNFAVRNIEGFNQKLKKATPEMLAKIHQYYENEPDDHYELPYLVIIVDEFADLMLMKARQEIETNISRLAAKARAAGIHLVLATQRPSVDVITGVIKSNFPTRVAFKVTSQQDSRTILTTMGAEKLLGKGDALFRNGTENIRVHSSYVDEEEIEALTDRLCEMSQSFHSGAMDFLENGGEEEKDAYSFGSHITIPTDASNSDAELYKQAIKVVIEQQTASASMLQRRLRIGYNRAALLIEQMEERGIIGPARGSKRRDVLVGSDDF